MSSRSSSRISPTARRYSLDVADRTSHLSLSRSVPGVLSRTATGLAVDCQIGTAAALNGGSRMAEAPELLRDEEWRDALAATFNGLIPDWPPNGDPADIAGWLTAARLSNVSAFHVAGSSQVLRRSSVRARRLPSG